MASERIDPLFFGSKERPLFGCHHGPDTGAASRLGVVIAPPLGHEYSRAHRALRRLAASVAATGQRALRFDFGGTGDSAGDDWPSSLDLWAADLEHALRELQLRARVPRLALLGVRLSANLALDLAARGRPLEALVLWDPVFDGAEFASALSVAQRRFESTLHSRAGRGAEAAGGRECLGFLWPTALVDGVVAWRPPRFEKPPAERVLILESRATARAEELAGEFARLGARVSRESSSGSQPWNEDVDRGLVPAADLQRIVAFLGGAA